MLEIFLWKDKVVKGYFNSWVEEYVVYYFGQCFFLEGIVFDCECLLWYILEGKKLLKVKCFFFCDGEILKIFNEVIEKLLGGVLNLDFKFRVKQQYYCFCYIFFEELIFFELFSFIKCFQDDQVVEFSNRVKCLFVGFLIRFDF